MIEQMKIFKGNTLAFQAIDSFTEIDVELAHKFFNEKIAQGHKHVNVLICLDELKISHINVKAFMEDIIWVLRKFKQIGNIAIVAHSNILKAMVPLDSFFFDRLKKGFEERYFDITQLDEAMVFVEK